MIAAQTAAGIANKLLAKADACDKTAAKAHLYEARLRAEGRAAAYRSAAKLVAMQLRAKKPDRRSVKLQSIIASLSEIVTKTQKENL